MTQFCCPSTSRVQEEDWEPKVIISYPAGWRVAWDTRDPSSRNNKANTVSFVHSQVLVQCGVTTPCTKRKSVALYLMFPGAPRREATAARLQSAVPAQCFPFVWLNKGTTEHELLLGTLAIASVVQATTARCFSLVCTISWHADWSPSVCPSTDHWVASNDLF